MKLLVLALFLSGCIGLPDRATFSYTDINDSDDRWDDAWEWSAGLEFPILYEDPPEERWAVPPATTPEEPPAKPVESPKAWYRDPEVRQWILGALLLLLGGERGYKEIQKRRKA